MKISPLAMLRKIRGGVTQAQLAEALGVERNTVVRWENGRSIPKLEPCQTKKLCKLLGISIDELPDSFAPQSVYISLDQPMVKD
ncbi:helix-turn-helix transcriptional regulator [Pseudanabaena sp. 'Roaring Creek']|uniref:helix-turn-helix transcriptional regulator n=1 Tax=Pseudanabaena sp. 'Roaring Creek' TaxID=1681830 RepID=UPI0006D7A5E9|nr:helix-turn-helix transcriptional regulator [Pseudanabaena sp. 'Roaring Creek']